jgi:predicted Zn-dependent protease
MSIAAILHAPGLANAGVPCQLRFSDNTLLIEGEFTFAIPVDSLEVTVGGFGDDTLFLNWLHDGVHHSAVITDRATQQELAAIAPAIMASKIIRSNKTLSYHRNKWNTLLAVAAALVLAFLLVWWQSEAVTVWLAEQVSLEREEQLGETILAQLKDEGTLTQAGLAADTVKAIGAQLTQGSRYQYQWYVKQDASINAFAIPGGIVVVHSGLLEKAASAEELAGVLAHEVQHVERRHSLQQLIHSAGWAALLTVTLGDVSAISGVFIHQLGSLRHSRKLEREADVEGVKALVKAGISPDGMASFFKSLQTEQAKKSQDTEIVLLSTHPATSERMAEIASLIKANPCSQCQRLQYDWPVVMASLKEEAKQAK